MPIPTITTTSGVQAIVVASFLASASDVPGALRVINDDPTAPLFLRADSQPIPFAGVPTMPFSGYLLMPGADVNIRVSTPTGGSPIIYARHLAGASGAVRLLPSKAGLETLDPSSWAFSTVPANTPTSTPLDGVLGRRTGPVLVRNDSPSVLYVRGDGTLPDLTGTGSWRIDPDASLRINVTGMVAGVPTLQILSATDGAVAVTTA